MNRKGQHNHRLTPGWQPQEDCEACQAIQRGQEQRSRVVLSQRLKDEIAALPPLTEQQQEELRPLLSGPRHGRQPRTAKEAA